MWDTEKSRRIKIMTAIIVGVILFLVVRLAWMQVLQGAQYKKIAEANRIRQILIAAPRGSLYDRTGALLVGNRPSFAISIVPTEYTSDPSVTAALADITGVPAAQIQKMLEGAKDFPLTPIRVKRDANDQMVAKVEERKGSLPGVIIEAMPVRQYVYKELAAHVFGYVGGISEEEYAKRKAEGYNPSDLIGKDGIEREWEGILRGVDGGLQIEVNAMGEEVGTVGNKAAVPGQGIVLTLDANLQKVAETALAEQIAATRKLGEPAKGGCVLVLDVKTGALLVMASNPSFDPNVFAGGISSREWDKLINNPNNPLTNKNIQNAYPPGSVFKIVTMAAALDRGDTNLTEIFDDRGVYNFGGWDFYGWEPKGLGKLDIMGALTWSSDPVFYELGRRMGVDNLAGYAFTFGYGKTTGIKLPGEITGTVPTEAWKLATYGEEWYGGESIIAAIGQGYYLATPLQQALSLMAVANGGIVYRPLLVDKVLGQDGLVKKDYQPEILRTIYLRPEYWDAIRQGLKGVTTQGTAVSVFSGCSISVAGKTGSAETGTGTTHSWFACYAPA
ncbi:MAG: penicillin-binding protein 2, partial [Pelosinus sp.]|nr:penicillin-binding protein 2 [Pelosinus sp.]